MSRGLVLSGTPGKAGKASVPWAHDDIRVHVLEAHRHGIDVLLADDLHGAGVDEHRGQRTRSIVRSSVMFRAAIFRTCSRRAGRMRSRGCGRSLAGRSAGLVRIPVGRRCASESGYEQPVGVRVRGCSGRSGWRIRMVSRAGMPGSGSNEGAFAAAGQFTIGNSSRDPVRGPGLQNADLMLSKMFRVSDRWSVRNFVRRHST